MDESNERASNEELNTRVLLESARVLVRNLREKVGPKKIKACWENMYRVLGTRFEGLIYLVQLEKGEM